MSRSVVPILAGVVLSVFVAAQAGRTEEAPAGEIVFTSNRATGNPGEVYALAVGAARRNVTNNPAVDMSVAVAANGSRIAFWSNRSGRWQLFVARPDGGAARAVLTAGEYPSGLPDFTADGSRLLAAYLLPTTSTEKVAIVDVRTGSVRTLPRCGGAATLSPDGRAAACAGPTRVDEVDTASGRVEFSAAGEDASWSSGGRLAVGGLSGTTVVDERGRVLVRYRELLGAWSPDGRLLALTDHGSITVVEPGVRNVLRVAGSGYWLAFTGDSRYLGYSGTKGLHLAALSGGKSYTLRDGYGVWAADGRYAFLRPVKPHNVLVEIADELDRHARVVGRFDLDDHGVSRLVWLPGGGRLLYETYARSHDDLWEVEADGSSLRRLTSNGNDISTPAWSADGRRLAYGSSDFSGGNAGFSSPRVVVADAAGHALSTIESGYEGYSPSWSPDGRQLVVANGFSGELDVVGTNGRGRRAIVTGGRSPAWSPDGSTIAYCAGDGVHGVAPNGANDRVLVATSAQFAPVSVAWSPDGTQLAYTNERGVFVTAADGSGAHRLLHTAQEAGTVSFSPDGAWLVFSADAPSLPTQPDLFLVAVDGSSFHALAPSSYIDTDPAWRPTP